MRQLLLLTTTCVLLAASAGWAMAWPGHGGALFVSKAAPQPVVGVRVVVPASPPVAMAVPGGGRAYGYRSVAALSALVGGQQAAATNADVKGSHGVGAVATVEVSATVLPVRTIVVDRRGHVTQIWSNTEDRDGRNSLYVVRRSDVAGAWLSLDAATWAQASKLLAHASRTSGRIA